MKYFVFDLQRFVNYVTLTGGNDRYTNSFTRTNLNAYIAALDGNDSITNECEAATVDGGDGDDSIHNKYYGGTTFGWNSSLSGGNGNDTIIDDGDSYRSFFNTLDGGSGNDYIKHAAGNKVTVDGGFDNDTIIVGGQYNSLNGGSGNDQISLTANVYDNTVTGGKGNDIIYNKDSSTFTKTTYQFSAGDGHDTIFGTFKYYDALLVNSPNVEDPLYSVICYNGKSNGYHVGQISRDDIFIMVGDYTNSIRLKDFDETEFTLKMRIPISS